MGGLVAMDMENAEMAFVIAITTGKGLIAHIAQARGEVKIAQSVV